MRFCYEKVEKSRFFPFGNRNHIVYRNVSASALTDDTNYPIEVLEMSEQTGEPIITAEDGVYYVGRHLFIDISTYKQNEIIPQVYGSEPPSSKKVWAWDDGEYYGEFTCSLRVFTNYRFTGYANYDVDITIGDSGHIVTTGAGKVGILSGNSSYGTSYNFTDYVDSFTFTGCDPAKAYCFYFSKANDGRSVNGKIYVNHG